jgi:hypothetical protein
MNVDLGDADAAVGIALQVITDFLRELARLGRLPTRVEFDRDLGGQTFHVVVLLDPPYLRDGDGRTRLAAHTAAPFGHD